MDKFFDDGSIMLLKEGRTLVVDIHGKDGHADTVENFFGENDKPRVYNCEYIERQSKPDEPAEVTCLVEGVLETYTKVFKLWIKKDTGKITRKLRVGFTRT